MAANEILLGRTGSAAYTLRGMWVIRQIGERRYRYDTLDGFVREMLTGALGSGWKETPQGSRIIDRFVS